MIWKRQICLLLVSLSILLLGGIVYGYEFRSRSLFAVDEKRPKYVSGEVLVGFKSGTSDKAKYQTHERCGAMAAYPHLDGRFERVKFGNVRSVEEMIALYEKQPDVEYAEPNYIAHAFLVPNDPFYRDQWHFHSPEDVPGGANFEPAWDISTGEGVIVAVIDSGVAYEDYEEYHQAPELSNVTFVPGYDFVDDDDHPNDKDGHGTFVTSIIALDTNNGIGIAGAAFDCSIMPIRVLGDDGTGTYVSIVEGIKFAAENGAHVINLSLGGEAQSISLMLSLHIARDAGVTFVAAAGNEFLHGSPLVYPAAYDGLCIAVSAVRHDGGRAWYSSIGDYIDIAAPGGDLSLDQNRDGQPDGILAQTFFEDPSDLWYFWGEGTSFSAPHVSAAAAMLISSGMTDPDKVAEALTQSARDTGVPGKDDIYGHGILDVYEALKYDESIFRYSGSDGALNTFSNLANWPTNENTEQYSQANASSFGDSVRKQDVDGLPDSTALYQNYPNPFNAETWIPFQLKKDANVMIKIYTETGKLVRTLDLGRKSAGFYTKKDMAAYWDGRDEAGEKLTSKIYFYIIEAGSFSATRKMVIRN